jgi:WD40 repeat protein
MTDLKLTGWGGALSSNGTQAAAATIERNLCLWDVRSGEVRATFSGHETPIYCAAFGPNDETLLTGGGPRSILWAAKTCEILEVFQGGTGPVWAVALSPDGRLAATGSQDSAGRVWDTKTGKLLAALEAHTAPVTAVGFIAEGTYLITGSQDKNLFLWDVASGEVVDTLYLAHKVSCGAAHKNLAILGDYGGAVYFFAVDNV